MKTVLLSTLLVALFVCPGVSQPTELTIGERHYLESKALNETRPIYIHLPDTYKGETSQLPVLIVLDGDWHFRKVIGIVDHLSASERIPQHIVVGIPNILAEGRPARLRDLAPTTQTGNDGASNFLQFITDELIPHLNQTYRTQPHYTLLGHSMGGLFTIYTMLERPEAFAAFVAISPSLGRNNQQQVARASNAFEVQNMPRKNLQLMLGNEGGNTQAGTEALVAVLEKQAPTHLDWRFHHFEEEDHVSVFHPATSSALEAVFDGWQIPASYLTDLDISIVERHYKALSARLGFEIQVPASYYSELGYRILASHEFDYAQWTFEQYAAAYPNAAAPLTAMGDVHLMQGNLKQAKAAYKEALQRDAHDERARHMYDALTQPDAEH